MKEGFKIRLLQVDTLCHKFRASSKGRACFEHRGLHRSREHQSIIPRRCQEAPEQDLGISGDVPRSANQRHDCAGYILGFPTDTPESIARDIEIIKKELPVDILNSFI